MTSFGRHRGAVDGRRRSLLEALVSASIGHRTVILSCMYFLQSGGNPGPGGIPGGPQGDLPLHGRAHAPQPCGRCQQVESFSLN